MRFSCVESTWDWLSLTIPVDSKLVASLPVASCNLRDVLKLQLRALAAQSEWKTPNVYRPGELWIILGIDGVPLWKSHVVAGTLALTGSKCLPLRLLSLCSASVCDRLAPTLHSA